LHRIPCYHGRLPGRTDVLPTITQALFCAVGRFVTRLRKHGKTRAALVTEEPIANRPQLPKLSAMALRATKGDENVRGGGLNPCCIK
jgi:hypothetical protein